MRQKYIYLYILFLAGISCETEPEICVGFSSTPVIYTIFDRSDTISHIYVARSFSGNPHGPMINAKLFDSIYYDNVSIQAELLFAGKEHDEIISYHDWEAAVEEQAINRNPGIFSNPIGRRYTIFRDLDSCYFARLSIYIPSFDTIKLKTPIIPPPIMDYPQVDGSYITLHRTKTLPISWYGYAWNELKVEIEIETAIQGSHTIIDTLTFWKNNIVFPDDPKSNHYVSIFSFESYLKLLDTQLSRVNNVKFRKIKNISIEIICGSDSFKNYMSQFGELIDNVLTTYHSEPKSLVASKSFKRITGLHLDPESQDSLLLDPSLTKYKFVYY